MTHTRRPACAVFIGAAIIAFTLVGCDDSEPRAEKLRMRAKDNAKIDCREAVRSAAKFPSEADVPWNLGRIGKASDGGYLVVGDVKLMNSFGAMIPHKFVCRHKNGRAEVISLRPG